MIRVAINGYGNLGRGAERAIAKNDDMELVVVFTRRDPSSITTLGAPVVHVEDAAGWVDKVDVCLNCGGSATDLEYQGPATAEFFHTVDSFDTHAKIPSYFAAVDAAAKYTGHLALISTGWDPGLFSMLRVLGDAVLPEGTSTTFWGPGVSQGHSDAIRRIDGVLDARQYTLPVPQEVAEMPDYFADYDTTVHFITAEEMAEHHAGLPHGGTVIRKGTTSEGTGQRIGFELELDSNPEFTGSVLAAMGRAVARMAARGESGARTVFDVTLADLSPRDPDDLRAHWL